MVKQIVRNAPQKQYESAGVSRAVDTSLHHIMVIDTETTIDISQRLRVAGYVVYDRSHDTTSEAKVHDEYIKERGLVYDLLSEDELHTLTSYCMSHQLKLWKRDAFITQRFYPLLFAGSAFVNHNIKFDIGTLATSWYFPDKDSIAMRLCTCTGVLGYDTSEKPISCAAHPSIIARHLPSGKYLYAVDTEATIGAIIDTMSLGRALLGPAPMSLKDMGTRFRCERVKFISDGHGDTLSDEYLDYTMNDVLATLELFIKELREYNRYGLDMPISSIVSEAGIGKAMLAKMGVTPFYKRHRDVPSWYEAIAARAYKGGRSEVMNRLTPVEILYCDFKSQYPLVNALLGLQDLLLSQSVTVIHRNVASIRRWLADMTIEDLADKRIWKKLRMFVKIVPHDDILPVETVEAGSKVYRNASVRGSENWYTMCDIIASILRTGKLPEILDVVEMLPYGKIQTNVIKFFGEDKYTIDASTQDFFAEVINVRSDVKRDMKKVDKLSDEYAYLNSLQLALKLIANSTSYGALCETREVNGIDIAGKYAVYAIAAHITAGGRLLLAIAETLGKQRDLRYVMCDTDSMSFARPEGITREDFHRRVHDICDFFRPLSPYKGSNDIFELEEVNGDNPLETPLYFIGVSSKRYVVYNRLEDGSYAIRKATVNGVGYVQFDRKLPFPDDIPYPTAKSIYEPTTRLAEYQYILWYRCIQQVERGITDVQIPIEAWSMQIVRNQISLSTPHQLKIHSYISGIRPFGFFTKLPSGHYYAGDSTSEAIEHGTLYRLKVNTIDDNPHFLRLYECFRGYFTHAEAKVVDGSKVGWLEKVQIQVTEIAAKSKSGKEVNTQLTLFS